MSDREQHPLFRTAVLELVCAGGLGGGSVEVRDGTGSVLASGDRAGTVVDSAGAAVLRAAVRFSGSSDRGTNAMVDVTDPDGTPLGEVRLERFTVTPRSRKATLWLGAEGTELARIEPADGKGEQLMIASDDRHVGTLHRRAKKGFLRTSTAYRLELTGDLDARTRQLIVAAAISYHSLVSAAAGASQAT